MIGWEDGWLLFRVRVIVWSTTSDITTLATTDAGVLGRALKYPLGSNTDVAILGMGFVIGAIATLAFSRFYRRPQSGGIAHLCPYCRMPYSLGDDYCHSCGGNLRDYEEPEEQEDLGIYQCSRCGCYYSGNFCPNCGPPIYRP